MAGQLCTGATGIKNASLKNSKAFCEGVEYRSQGSAASFPITGNPEDGVGSEAETAWDAGWNFADDQSIPFELTGTIDPAASVSVVGVGTLFETELISGDVITVSGENRIVDVITDNTLLSVTVAFSNNANDTTPQRVRPLQFDATTTCCAGKPIILA